MKNFTSLLLLAVMSIFTLTTNASYPDLAFPGAEGAGKYTTGGRGGTVYVITSLEDDGSVGTLRYAVQQSGTRTIVFAVSGIIELKSDLKITQGSLTIAGQTAPGDGICIKSAPVVITSTNATTYNSAAVTLQASDVIIRYIRFRPGDEIDNTVGASKDSIFFEHDAIYCRNRSDIIIDHCSMSWGIDETGSFYDNSNFTLQYCILSESLHDSYHPKYEKTHGYGGIWGGQTVSFHHNLLAHHSNRNPRFCGSRYSGEPEKELVDYRNNVVYNYVGGAYGGEGGSYNLVNNYIKYGPATSDRTRVLDPYEQDGVMGTYYITGSYIYGSASTTADNWKGVVSGTDYVKSDTEFDFADFAIEDQSALVAFEYVLSNCGAVLPERDPVDARIIEETMTGTYHYSGVVGKGLIDSPSDVGGYPTYSTTTPPTDTDADGIPDYWEDANGTDKNTKDASGTTVSGNYYTNIEMYINSLVEENEKSFVLRPINLTVDSVDYQDVYLTWEDISNNETKFIIERKLYDVDDWMVIDSVTGNVEAYTDTTTNEFTRYDYRIKAANDSVESFYTESVRINIEDTGIPVADGIISKVTVYPNPFNNDAKVIVRIDAPAEVNLSIFNVAGKEISILDKGFKAIGEYTYNLTSTDFSPGVYFLRVATDNNSKMIRMVKQ